MLFIESSFGNGLSDNKAYDVTLRRVRVTIVAVENQYILHILSMCL
jgi:hypothetical protein